MKLADRMKIQGDGTSHGTNLFLDGERVEGLCSIEWKVEVDRPTVLIIELSGNPAIEVAPPCAG